MLNILMPLGGNSKFFDEKEYFYPKLLVEIQGKPMIQLAIENLQTIGDDLQFIFVIKKSDCVNFHLDETLKLLTNDECKIITLDHDTKGAPCSCLLAIEYINNSTPLLISNYDQVFDCSLKEYRTRFDNLDVEAGCLIFNSAHPRWSYVHINDHGFVMEAAEKRPLSRNAIAGFYYYTHGSNFIKSAQSVIRKTCSNTETFYTSSTFNELILENKRVGALTVSNDNYHSFYTPQKIEEFEKGL
jgi:dTDP-glucose pyrophosphorylase